MITALRFDFINKCTQFLGAIIRYNRRTIKVKKRSKNCLDISPRGNKYQSLTECAVFVAKQHDVSLLRHAFSKTVTACARF